MENIKKPISTIRQRALRNPNKIASIGLKKDLEEILANPTNLLSYNKSTKVTDNSIAVWYKDPASFSSNVYYEDKELMERDFKIFEKILKEANIKI